MREDVSEVSNFVGFLLEDVIVVVEKGLDEKFLELLVDQAKPLSEQPEEGLVNPLHHGALEDHIDKLVLVALGYVHLQDFMGALLEVDRGLDGQVDGLPQVDQVLLSQVLDALLRWLFVPLLLILVRLLQPRQVLLPQDLHLYLLPLLLGL